MSTCHVTRVGRGGNLNPRDMEAYEVLRRRLKITLCPIMYLVAPTHRTLGYMDVKYLAYQRVMLMVIGLSF